MTKIGIQINYNKNRFWIVEQMMQGTLISWTNTLQVFIHNEHEPFLKISNKKCGHVLLDRQSAAMAKPSFKAVVSFSPVCLKLCLQTKQARFAGIVLLEKEYLMT